ncbi:MAG: tRNA lysidine(34) synthetase TilS [Gemmatimonadetes bacterium]|nr:tRNA lysidine(34) synthetase TilS [Gemmatimonadota bacterium]
MQQAGPPALAPHEATPLGARFPRHLRETGLIRAGQTVVVAVSGGMDSVVLLHLLHFRLGEQWALRLVAAHLDHAMRDDSAADGRWVAGLCRAWGVPLVRARARRPPRSEAAARALRYRFLRTVALRRRAHRLATGHHADDQAETVLFRIIRGTGLRGLAGIPERRGRLVRPLLRFPRAQIAEYAAAAGLSWREDPTNVLVGYARNRLRHEVLPRLEAIQPGAARALVRLAEHARHAETAWDAVLDMLEPAVLLEAREGAIELARPVLLSYHAPVRARVLRRFLRRLHSVPDRAGTRAAVEFIRTGASGGQIQVAGGVTLEREFDRIRLRRRPLQPEPRAAERPLVIGEAGAGEGEAVIGGRGLAVRWSLAIPGGPGPAEAFDPAALRFPLVVRAWRPGDRIRLAYGTKKLKKLFAERRTGRTQRALAPVLADAAGRVLWVVGVARSADAPPPPQGPALTIAVSDVELG